jgi:hypothetical protein
MTLAFVYDILFTAASVFAAATAVKRIKVRTLVAQLRHRRMFVDTPEENDRLEREVYLFLTAYAPIPRSDLVELHTVLDECRGYRRTLQHA